MQSSAGTRTLWVFVSLSDLEDLERLRTERTSLNDNTCAMLLYFIQTFPPCASAQPIRGAGQDSGAWSSVTASPPTPPSAPLFLIYRGKESMRWFFWSAKFYLMWWLLYAHFPFCHKFMKWEYASCYTLASKIWVEEKNKSKVVRMCNVPLPCLVVIIIIVVAISKMWCLVFFCVDLSRFLSF